MGRKFALLGAALVAVMVGSVHCGGPAKEGKQGGECFRAEECAEGLVCIEQKCTSDLSSVNVLAEGGMMPREAGAPTTD